MSNTAKKCPKCEAELPADAPAGLCPKCLLAAGLEDSEKSGRASADAPTIDSGRSADSTPISGTKIGYFGDYELLEEIAHGGMGVVFKARQVSLNRIVAVKLIRAGQLASQPDIQRFHAEAEAAAQLDHPGIVPIYEVGEHKGEHYFSMAYVSGQNLAERLHKGPLPPKEAARFVQKIAEAVAYGHKQGVIHRDLKPSNVLLDTSDEPKLTDFGLAKRLDVDSDLTASGQILGTPAYMAPEQASGNSDMITAQSDVYSLGAILYALLTGRPPFQAASSIDTLMQVIEHDPVSPRRLDVSIPKDIESICLKCLEKKPAARYESADALADDIDRFLRDEPVKARPLTRLTRCWRWCDRHMGRYTTILIISLLFVPGLVFLALGFLFGEWPVQLLMILYPAILILSIPYFIAMIVFTRLHEAKRRAAIRSPSTQQESKRSLPLIFVGGLMAVVGIVGYLGLIIANDWQVPKQANLFLFAFIGGLSVLSIGCGIRPYQ